MEKSRKNSFNKEPILNVKELINEEKIKIRTGKPLFNKTAELTKEVVKPNSEDFFKCYKNSEML